MKRPHQITGAAFMLLSAFIAWESLQLGLTTSLGPGPGFFPFWVSVLLGLLAAGMFYRATFGEASPMPEDFSPGRSGLLRIAAIALAIVGTIVLLHPLGFRLTMLTFLVFLLFALGRQKPAPTAIVALAGSFGTYYAFVEWLRIPLPIGVLGL